MNNDKPLVSFDYAIKYLLKDKGDYGIVEGFISALLKTKGYKDIKIVALLETESNKEDSKSKRSLADLIVEDEDHHKYIIEIERNVKDSFIHNTSWGWQDVHVRFKNVLDTLTDNAIHTDIQKSELPKTGIWNITKKPPISYLEKFDIVVNISTVEEVNYDHIKVFNNLLSQVKVGGILICTFDLPGLQLEKFEKRFEKKLLTFDNDVTGASSKLQNLKFCISDRICHQHHL
jgi:hypothetical protein